MDLAKLIEPDRKEAMRLSRFDLNLLVVFEALMEERSVSRAADRLALSQPAASHALNRLRALLDDPLFIRTPAGMEPTARALQLATPIRRALADMAQALEPEDFLPATAERSFTLALNNHAALVLATPIMRACGAEAPGVRLQIRPSGTLAVEDLLDRGDLDFAITAKPLDRQRFASQVLMEDEFRIVMGAHHPLAGAPLSIEQFAELARVEVSSSGEDTSFVTRALENAGLRARKLASVPYLALPSLLQSTDCIAVVRGQIANALAQQIGGRSAALPFPSQRVASLLHWHQRHSGDASYLWLISIILRASAAFVQG